MCSSKLLVSLLQKIKELTYMHSEGILSGELKHGPLAMIDEEMPVIMLITKDNTYKVPHPHFITVNHIIISTLSTPEMSQCS